MNVAATCCRPVITVGRRDEILTAARLMREHEVGFMVVSEQGTGESSKRPVGVLTDRGTAIRRMQHFGVRRPPVVSEHGELKDILSLDDLMRSLPNRVRPCVGGEASVRNLPGIARGG